MIRGICEPFAATAAVTRAVLAGPNLPAPCGFMGAKQSMASTLILPAAGVRPGCGAERVVLADGGPWGEFWLTCRTPSGCRGVAQVLRGWRTERPTELWDRLVGLAPMGGAEGVAQYLWIQARAASNTPTWWDGSRWVMPTGARGGLRRPDLYPVSQRLGGKQVRRAGGVMDTVTIARRLEVLGDILEARVDAGLRPPDVVHGDCGAVVDLLPEDLTGWVVYLDPPYATATRYAALCDRDKVVALALQVQARGALVVVSEAEPLPLGWPTLDITTKRKPEWLTMSCEPSVRPSVQQGLFARGAA